MTQSSGAAIVGGHFTRRGLAAGIPRVTISSRGGSRSRPGGVRLLALLAARNEREQLPGYLANASAQVDGIVALDDGSTDGTAELLAAHPAVLEVVQVPLERPDWNQPGNYRRLAAAALRHRPDWLISVDADERLERHFRSRAERVIARGRRLGFDAYRVRIRELWQTPDTYRVDGAWARKAPARLFRARPDQAFDGRALHAHKVPLQARRIFGRYPVADLEVYHLNMLTPERRVARRRRLEEADPEAHWQPEMGYAYLTDERGLRLQVTLPGRDYLE
jgi:glycosyltransferase involved in cell wall biosynthesis